MVVKCADARFVKWPGFGDTDGDFRGGWVAKVRLWCWLVSANAFLHGRYSIAVDEEDEGCLLRNVRPF